MSTPPKHFQTFQTTIAAYSLPKQFTFPFYYEPHPLCRVAAQEIQQYLQKQTDWEHNFEGKDTTVSKAIGKMFGVLIVQTQEGTLGYLAAFSGKLGDSNHYNKFVPPVFDTLQEEGFFKRGERELNQLNRQIEVLESQPDFRTCQQVVEEVQSQATIAISEKKAQIKIAKQARKIQRQQAQQGDNDSFQALLKALANESFTEQTQLKKLKKVWKQRIADQEEQLTIFQSKIQELKERRKRQSANLQQQLFEAYHFLNQYGTVKNLLDIFKHTTQQIPPAGAGECAAPKLLQYAFQHQLKPSPSQLFGSIGIFILLAEESASLSCYICSKGLIWRKILC